MKGLYKNRISTTTLLLCTALLFIFLTGCAGLNPAHERTHIKIKGKQEILVAKNIGRGGEIYRQRWCGNSGMVYRLVDTEDVEVLDFETGKRTPVNIGHNDILLNCSADGRKVFYLPAEKNQWIDERDPVSNRWYTETGAIYMYDIGTDKKNLIANIKDPKQYDAISPDGKKIFLGARHSLVGNKGASELKILWFTEEWNLFRVTWFSDSSGVLGFGVGASEGICVERFGKDGWAKCFEIKDGNYGTVAPRVDMENRVYFLVSDMDVMTESVTNYLHRCEIKERELSCERIIKDYNVMPTYGVLSDGDIIFQDYDGYGDCILRITPGRDVARCEITPRYGESVYGKVSLQGLSPDGRWLVFDRYTTREWRERADGMGSDLWQGQMDMFVIDLMEE